jgi:hypothetical protein
MNRKGIILRSWMVAALLVAALGWLLPDPLQAQQERLYTLVDENRAAITGDNFATLISNNLIRNGMSNVKDAEFLFQECFGRLFGVCRGSWE